MVGLVRSGSGVAGVADVRIQTALDALAAAGAPITPTRLATGARSGYLTALRWLKIHHPGEPKEYNLDSPSCDDLAARQI